MKELLVEMQASAFMEYERAAKKFGPANNSPHESYAVILEEFEEAKSELNSFEWCHTLILARSNGKHRDRLLKEELSENEMTDSEKIEFVLELSDMILETEKEAQHE